MALVGGHQASGSILNLVRLHQTLAAFGRTLGAIRAAVEVYDIGAGGEEVSPLEAPLLKGGDHGLLLAPCAADKKGATILAFFQVQARVVVLVGRAGTPVAVGPLFVAFNMLEDLLNGPHAAPPSRFCIFRRPSRSSRSASFSACS